MIHVTMSKDWLQGPAGIAGVAFTMGLLEMLLLKVRNPSLMAQTLPNGCARSNDWTTIVAQLDDLCYSSAMVEFAHWLATSWHIWTFLVGGFDIQQVVCCSISNSNKCFSTNVVQQMSQIGWQISKLTLWWLLGRTAGSGNHPQQSLISSSRPSNWNLTLTIPSQTINQSKHHPCERQKGSRIFDPCLEL